MKHGLQVVIFCSRWIQYENLRNVVHGSVEGWSLEWGSWSFLPVVVGKSDHGVGAPFRKVLGNKIRGLDLLSIGCWRTREGCSLLQWIPACWYESAPIQDCNKFFFIIKRRQRWQQWWFFPTLGFHLKSWCSCVLIMCDGLFFSYCTWLLFL